MLRSKKQTYLINQSNFTSRNFQNRKLPILFSRVQNSPRGGAAQLATIQQARRAPTRFFLSVVAYCPPSPLPLTREKKKPKVPGSEGGVDYPRADSRVGNYSFRGECSNSKAGHHLSLFVYSRVSVVGRLGQRQRQRYCFINPPHGKKEAVHHPVSLIQAVQQ